MLDLKPTLAGLPMRPMMQSARIDKSFIDGISILDVTGKPAQMDA